MKKYNLKQAEEIANRLAKMPKEKFEKDYDVIWLFKDISKDTT